MCFTMDERLVPDPVNCLVVDFVPTAVRSAEQVSAAPGPAAIRVSAVIVEGTALVIVVETVQDGDEHVIAERVREAIAA